MTRARDASTPISRRRLLVGGGVLAGSAAVGAVALRTADPFYANASALSAKLDPPPAGAFFEGCHDTDSWRVVAPAQVDFLGNALGA